MVFSPVYIGHRWTSAKSESGYLMDIAPLTFDAVRGLSSHGFTHLRIFPDSALRHFTSPYLPYAPSAKVFITSHYTHFTLNLDGLKTHSRAQFESQKSMQDSNISPNPATEIFEISAKYGAKFLPMPPIFTRLVAERLRGSTARASAYSVFTPLAHPRDHPRSPDLMRVIRYHPHFIPTRR
ncbi:hypothetical protein C8R43DRAFT_1230898, partial [Mycena crocata]